MVYFVYKIVHYVPFATVQYIYSNHFNVQIIYIKIKANYKQHVKDKYFRRHNKTNNFKLKINIFISLSQKFCIHKDVWYN